jgi:hypothetical protein
MLAVTLLTTYKHLIDRQMKGQYANASTKLKELQTATQRQSIAAHLLLPLHSINLDQI